MGFDKNLFKIDGFEISFHKKSKRIIDIKINDEIIEKLIFPFHKFDITSLEYKPFTRFTIAKSLNEVTSGKLSSLINFIVKDREIGCFIIGPKNINPKIDDTFLVKLSTAISHLIGLPNYDSMANKYYARFYVKHEDNSDSYLRKAYTNMDLHTDGTYVKEKTDKPTREKPEETNSEFLVMGEDDMNVVKGLESTVKIDCDKCHNQEGVWWTFQTRSGDEPETKFYRCTKCNYTWRDYT